MNGYYHGEIASTMCETSTAPVPEPIPAVLAKANACLAESICHMQPIFKLLFGDEVATRENEKCDNMTQMANNIANNADEIFQAVRALRERLGA